MSENKKTERFSHSTQRTKRKNLIWFISLAAVFSSSSYLGILGLYFWNFHGGFSNSNGDWGTFGDFVGGTVNPIFSFLSFVGLLYAIAMQSKEIENSETALMESREAYKEQKRHNQVELRRSDIENAIKATDERIENFLDIEAPYQSLGWMNESRSRMGKENVIFRELFAAKQGSSLVEHRPRGEVKSSGDGLKGVDDSIAHFAQLLITLNLFVGAYEKIIENSAFCFQYKFKYIPYIKLLVSENNAHDSMFPYLMNASFSLDTENITEAEKS